MARLGRIGAMHRPRAEHGPPAAVVDVGWVNGLAAIRSLGRSGIRVLAVDHRPSALGFRSRYAEPLVTPDQVDISVAVTGPYKLHPSEDMTLTGDTAHTNGALEQNRTYLVSVSRT